jgi:eukaryotic-like serine/threonine-protein kinase
LPLENGTQILERRAFVGPKENRMNRWKWYVIFFVGMLVVGCSLPSALRAESKAAQFLATPQHSGVFPSSAPRGIKAPNMPTPTLHLKWSFKTHGKIRGSAAVAGSMVFIGSEDGNLYSLDKLTGVLRWKFSTGGEITSSPAVVNGILYFTGEDSTLYALDAEDGKEKWEFKTGAALPFQIAESYPATWDYYVSSPLVADGRVYIGSGDGNLYAIDSASGKQNWKFKTEGRVRTTPALFENTLYFGSFDGNLYAVNPETGALRWKFRTEGNQYFKGEIQFSPSVGNGMVCFGARDGFIYALDARTGEKKWRADHKGSWATACIISDGVVYGASSDGAFVQALDAPTGRENWRYNPGGRVFSSPAIAGGILFFGCQNSFLTGVDIKEGKPQIGTGANGEINSSPVISEGIIFIGSDDSVFYAFE